MTAHLADGMDAYAAANPWPFALIAVAFFALVAFIFWVWFR